MPAEPETAPDPTVAELADYLHADADDYMASTLVQASHLVRAHIGVCQVPAEIVARAILEVAAELWNRRNAPNGVASFGDGMGGIVPMRVARDPMVAAYALLAPWIAPVFA